MILGVVADDITGANDIGSMVAKAGYVTHVYPFAGLEDLSRAPRVGEADVVILDTDSRFDDPRLAYEKVFAATRALKRMGCERFYNKTCSVFRGNIGAEFDAMLDALGADFAIVVLGFPKAGRTTNDGVHYVHGQRLEDSPFREDPVHPMTRSNLVEILRSQTDRRVGLLTHEVIAQGTGPLRAAIETARGEVDYLILDVPNQAALVTIAGAVSEEPVLCGSSSLAEELPARWRDPGQSTPQAELPPHRGTGILCVAGSLTPQTRAQVEYLRAQGTPVWTLDTDCLFDDQARDDQRARLITALSQRLANGGDGLLQASSDPAVVARTRETGAAHGLSGAEVGRLVSSAMAEVVRVVVEATGVNRLVIAGGDTSAATCARLGVSGVRVWREIQPGLPSCLTLEGAPRLLVLKSGSFGSPDFLQQAIAHLKRQGNGGTT